MTSGAFDRQIFDIDTVAWESGSDPGSNYLVTTLRARPRNRQSSSRPAVGVTASDALEILEANAGCVGRFSTSTQWLGNRDPIRARTISS